MRRRGLRRWSGSSLPAGRFARPRNPSRSAGCFPPRRRARNRSTGRRRRRSRCCGGPGRAAAATDTAPGWCPGIRPPGCSGSGGGSRPGHPAGCAEFPSCAGSGRRNPRRSGFAAGPDRRHTMPGARPLAKSVVLVRRDPGGRQAAVLPALDHRHQRRPASSAWCRSARPPSPASAGEAGRRCPGW